MNIVRWLVGSWVSRIYLVVVALVTVWSLWEVAIHPGPNFAEIWPLFLTFPVSLLLLMPLAGVGGPALFVACIVVSALVNAAALNGVVALTRRSRRTSAS